MSWDVQGLNVDVYKNLHKDIWSVRNRKTGRVVTHKKLVHVINASFVVQPAGRQKVLDEKRKKVHAFVRGKLSSQKTKTLYWRPVTYNPYKADHFCYKDTGEKVASAKEALLNEDGVWIPSDSQ